MTPEQKHYNRLLDEINGSISRLKTDISPSSGLMMAQEVRRHLNLVMADLAESSLITHENAQWWEK